ncbi:hypothetical protein [Salinispora arenicola]|uniref:Nuclease-like protein n=1 Tax=Salinispora arenicola TaxID=168697 RepID=A0A542XKB0_SALAC|nr:hypothetical protein [Salinispora arenicola]MCN0152378.1 hypothetical protein [Salinispora arenicola]NIL41962.1 hypothetical protein [Salinispora arenicola]TQL36302.1 hypothetical protein FB564_1390 [Salinispora arenicola]
MTVYPAHRSAPSTRALPSMAMPHPRTETDAVSPPRPSPLEWARRLRAERGARRLEAAGARALGRLDQLGPAWHVIEWPRTDSIDLLRDDAGDERAGFLVIGPSGLHAVTIVDHGRSRVLVAGEVVQINGKRPPYVAEARRDAKRASKALSEAVGLPIPVTPVLTFVGSGVISVYGLPEDCLMATHRELDRLLVAAGNRISPDTAAKLSLVAQHPGTWRNGSYRPAADYRWYSDGATTADKPVGHR